MAKLRLNPLDGTMIGYIASLPPICMAVPAKSPGAKKDEVGNTVNRVGVLIDNEPRPTPMAAR